MSERLSLGRGFLSSLLMVIAFLGLASYSQFSSFKKEILSYVSSSSSSIVTAKTSLSPSNKTEPAIEQQSLQPDHPLYIADIHRDAFAACLMVMDDNHRLAEWIPFHYFLMPLRHVVVLVDAKSSTSPKPVLDKWRPYMMIEEWTEDMLPTYSSRPFHSNVSDPGKATGQYIERQGVFYRACATHLKEKYNTSWTSFHDVDEYFVFNSKYLPNNASTLMGQPGSVLTTLRQVREQMAKGLLPQNDNYNSPCVVTYRILYGAKESTAEEIAKDVPTNITIHPERFETLRFRYHGGVQIGKSLFDLTHFKPNAISTTANHYFHHHSVAGAHRLLPWCPTPWGKAEHYFHVHHYVGSWESYNSRKGDPRKNETSAQGKTLEKWQATAKLAQGPDDTIRPWISAFCQYMGPARAQYLLSDVGRLN